MRTTTTRERLGLTATEWALVPPQDRARLRVDLERHDTFVFLLEGIQRELCNLATAVYHMKQQ
jgi:hypothetical protein